MCCGNKITTCYQSWYHERCAWYWKVNLVVNKYVKWSSLVGLGRNVLQNDILLHSWVAIMIHLETPNINTPFGSSFCRLLFNEFFHSSWLRNVKCRWQWFQIHDKSLWSLFEVINIFFIQSKSFLHLCFVIINN
jgi:hypothetical protein